MEKISRRRPKTKQKEGMQPSLLQQQQQFNQFLNQTRRVSLQQSEQELKPSDERFVAQSKKQADLLQLMLDRMIEQGQCETRADREELAQWKKSVQKEEKAKHTEDNSAWDRAMASLRQSEVQKSLGRQQAVDECDLQMHQKMFDIFKNYTLQENMTVFQGLQLELHQVTTERMSIQQKPERLMAENNKLKDKYPEQATTKLSIISKLKPLSKGPDEKHKQLMNNELKKLKCKGQNNEGLQRKTLHFLLADAMKFEKMWLTLDEEVKELLERALYMDSTIYQHVLHLLWEQPDLSGAKRLSQSSQCSRRQNQEHPSEAEEKSNIPRTVHRLMEILCEEAGFLIEVKIVNECQSLDENQRTRVKADYLFNILGIKDVSQLVDFLCKYGQQSSRHSVEAEAAEPRCSTGEVQTSPTAPVTSDPIDPTDVLQALNVFISHHRQRDPGCLHLRKSRSRNKWSVQRLKVLDKSEEEAYWKSLSSAITAHKLHTWEGAERSLQQHHAVLCHMAELLLKDQSLQQENSELKMLLMGLQKLSQD